MSEQVRAIILDIESSGLLADMLDYSSFPYKLKPDAELWCVVLRDAYTDEVIAAECKNITAEWLKTHLKGCTHLIGHNAIKFDFLTLKLFGVLDYTVGYLGEEDTVFGEPVKIVDTLILSRLLNPDRFGGHSLYSWGERTGTSKIDFRLICIQKGYIAKGSPKGEEFKKYVPEMLTYCIGDTETNKHAFFALLQEMGDYKGWQQAIKLENKLADLAIRRENLGFWFDKDLAIKCVEDLTQKMEELQNKVNPLLPPKPMTKGELNDFTPPKTQLTKDSNPTSYILKFAQRIGAEIIEKENGHYISFEDKEYELPFYLPLKTHTPADISNLDHVKMHLISLGWEPSEWSERNLVCDSKKIKLPYEKRIAALERWFKDTVGGKYRKERIAELGIKEEKVLEVLKEKLREDRPVRVPTSPKVRVGVDKELCPSLISLGEEVAFAQDFSLYLTYKHRRASIAGGDLEDVDYETEQPNTGFLSMYREVDGRIPTPAIEIGASTTRYRHIGVVNVARASSIYGKEMRSLFGSGQEGLQYGYDFSSLEARIEGHYVWKYTDGQKLAETLLAEKPNDLHTLTALKMNVPRDLAKSINYGIIYGAQIAKIMKMTRRTKQEATEIYNNFWEAVPALKELKKAVEKYWKSNGSTFIPGLDGRKINIRSAHSILNALLQSGGVICAKYVTVYLMELLEKEGLCIDPFIGKPDACSMIEMHDEAQLFVNQSLMSFKTFSSKEEAQNFVNNWDGEQLSAISEGKEWYITMPNIVSKSLATAVEKTQTLLHLNVPLGVEYIVNNNWYGCH